MPKSRIFLLAAVLAFQNLFLAGGLSAQEMFLKAVEKKPLDTIGKRQSKGESLFVFMGAKDLYAGRVHWFLKLEGKADWELYVGTYNIEKGNSVVTIRWLADLEGTPSGKFEIAQLAARADKSFDYKVKRSSTGRAKESEHLVAISWNDLPDWTKDSVGTLLLRKYKAEEVQQMLNDHERWKLENYRELLK
jgi:hypothetical protein